MKRCRFQWVDVVMYASAATFLAPLVVMLLTSFKPEGEVLNPESVVPEDWTWANYGHVLGWSEEAPFVQWLLNSLFISTTVTLLVLIFSSLTAYAIIRLQLPGMRWFFGLVLATMMLPGQLFLVPVYLILSRLGLLDTPWTLILPATAGGFGVFLLCQFMRAIPRSLEESARLDGCSSWGVYIHIVLPLSAPAMATLGVFTFIGSWNDFVGPLIFLDSIRRYTLPVGIALYQSSYVTEYGLTLATSVLATVPLLCVFAVFQRHIIESMASSGLKG